MIAAVAELRHVHREAVRFRTGVDDRPVAPADDLDLIPLTASVAHGPALEGPDGVFVLSPTGVLYALDPRHGTLRWARRLGIDSRQLPLRHGDGLIAILGDRRSVALLDAATGQTRWEHPLGSACVTAPTLVGDRLFVPTIAGQLEVVDALAGKGLGVFDIPQALTEEAVLEPGTTRLFVPGNVGYVYVLDIDAKACVDLVETGHAADSLVEPIWFTKKAFVLTEAAAGPTIRLRPVPVPGAAIAAKAFTVAGALAFPAWRDEGVLLMPTPPGRLTQVGRRLPGNADPLLFPLTPFETAALDAGSPSPALVVHADAENVWMLGQGRLQRMQRTFSARTGPGLRVRWAGGVPLGDPLHAGQIHVPTAGLPTLFVPFRNGPVAAAAAIHGETGKILWRTELGSRPLGEIVPLDGGVGWATSGGVFVRDVAGKITYRREPRPGIGLLVAEGRRSFGWTGPDADVRCRGGGRRPTFDRAAGGDRGDAGRSARVGRRLPARRRHPRARRARHARRRLRPELAARRCGARRRRHGDGARRRRLPRHGRRRFDCRDSLEGSQGLDGDRPGASRRRRPGSSGAPVRLGPKRLIVRDATNRIHRLDLDDKGMPAVRRSWSAGGKIAQGPFALGDRFAIVTTENRLIVYDPERDEPIWEREFAAELIGPPRRIDDDVLVADVDGNLWLLDAATGSNRGAEGRRPVWSARPNLAAAVAPMPLPNGDLFVIWTDGTASVLAKKSWRP